MQTKDFTTERLRKKLSEILPTQKLERILGFIEYELEEIKKSFGNCMNCYGKGYSTYYHGISVSPDFEGDKRYTSPKRIHMVFCTCERGKQLKKLTVLEEKTVLESILAIGHGGGNWRRLLMMELEQLKEAE